MSGRNSIKTKRIIVNWYCEMEVFIFVWNVETTVITSWDGDSYFRMFNISL